jgi:hypothetical protein
MTTFASTRVVVVVGRGVMTGVGYGIKIVVGTFEINM